MLRIDGSRLALTDAEKPRVEPGDVIEEGTPLRHRTPRHTRLGVVELLGIPPGRGNLGDQVVTLQQRSPQLVGGFDPTREPAAHADNGNWGGWCLGQVGSTSLDAIFEQSSDQRT